VSGPPRDLKRAHQVLLDRDPRGLPKKLESLGSARTTAWVHGVVRRRRTLHALLGAVARRALKKRAPDVVAALELGAFRILFSEHDPAEVVAHFGPLFSGRKPREHVARVLTELGNAVDERLGPHPGDAQTVPLDRERSVRFTKPLLELEGRTESTRLGLLHSLPDELVAAWIERHGADVAAEVCRACNDPPPLFARANPLRTDRAGLVEALAAEDVNAEPVEALEHAVRLRIGKRAFVHTEPWRQGWLVVQDLTAQRAAPTLAPQPGERILDACAAPGTKTTALAELSQDQATILAGDSNPRRLRRVEENARRLGLSSIQTLRLDARDAAAVTELGPFDAILADGPCSNTGVLRRRPEARWRYDPRAQKRLVRAQEAIARACLGALRPGGRMLWSVCAIEPEEGEGLVRELLAERPGLELLDEHLILPSPDGGDGGYQALLRHR
jgi:16S rRNA (cytosine967-C5)-methyltransferase